MTHVRCYSDFLADLVNMVDLIDCNNDMEVELMRDFCSEWGLDENMPTLTPVENIQYLFIMDSLLTTVEASDDWEEMLEMDGVQ